VDKPLNSDRTICAELHRAVIEFAPQNRRDRAKVNEAAAQAAAVQRRSAGY
jgi:hypothetical protein